MVFITTGKQKKLSVYNSWPYDFSKLMYALIHLFYKIFSGVPIYRSWRQLWNYKNMIFIDIVLILSIW